MGAWSRQSSVAFVTVGALVLGACGGSANVPPAGPASAATSAASKEPSAEMLAAAKKEGQVVFYAGKANEDLQTLSNAFTSKYGIKVVFKHSASGANEELAAQQLSAGNVLVDLISITPDPKWQPKWESKFVALTPQDIPNLAAVPDDQKSSTFVIGSSNYYGFVFNTKELKESDLPKDLMAFGRMKQLKGRVGTANPAASNSYATWHAMLYDTWGKDQYEKFIQGFIGDQKARMADSSSTLVNLVASGDLAIIGPTNIAQMQPLQAKGAPVAMHYFDPVMSLPDGWIILSGSPHPNAAKVFLNWLIGKEGQQVLCGQKKCGSYLKITDGDTPPAGEKIVIAPVKRGTELGQSYVIPLVRKVAGQ